ncbi:serine/threonine-protein kinase LATS2 [Polypterus senegalus]|uniref:serine/threonine-protein kinase LATS2 n=1 Tax=Polypterus senegalus TaxID=55291 RepID=UPI001965A8F6|nr:serine/threonine-protein kinase LATS2 [Polypterus senegalus]XP_039599948.1 serine/threonine-protein kinase LATS2 [Polypterus senegalus]
MRPKTFPATSYAGNSRQRLQEIREVLKQPPKPSSPVIPASLNNESTTDSKVAPSKDSSRQQQIRTPPKFVPYQKALREIRNSLMPFANDTGPSNIEVNRQMLQELVNAGCDQEMAVRALKQTGSRNIEAALDYISKMGYLDPRNEQIVRVIKQTSPGKSGLRNAVDRRPPMETSSDKITAYHQMGGSAFEGGGYGAESGNLMGEIQLSYMNVPVMNYILPSSQAPAMGNPMQRPPSIGPYASLGAQSSPVNSMYATCDLKLQQKPYPSNMEQAMINYAIPNHTGPSLQLPGAPGPSNAHFVRQHMIVSAEPSGYGVQRSPSFQNKVQQDNTYSNKGTLGQNSTGYSYQQPSSNLYLSSSSHPRQSSPTSHQVHMIARGPGIGSDFSDIPQNLLTPSRTSLNMDLYDITNNHQVQHWSAATSARHEPLPSPGSDIPSRQQQQQQPGPFRGEVRVPSRTNSFNNQQQKVHVTVRQNLPSGKTDSSHAPPNTITAVTSAPILQPVKSIRVMRPEPQTAVGPCHPGWLANQNQVVENSELIEQHPYAGASTETYTMEPVEYITPEPRCPPPPYPKNLLASSNLEQIENNCVISGVEHNTRTLPGQVCNTTEEANRAEKGDKCSSKAAKVEKAAKDKKQIQTSPVPVRKNMKDEEKRESRIKSYSPFAFKFYMEQHIENVMKTYQQKVNRRMQLEQEMSKAGLSEAEQEQMRKMLYQKESNYNRLKRAKMDKSMFVKIKTLGIGAFGEVCLTRKVDTNALYAMKTLRKKDVLNRNQVAHVKAERDILAEADNEWVVKLYYSFQDKDCLYFVMDYIPGGDMMSLLIRMGVFPENLARFYIAELTLAIESVHKMGFIHRDIKPDNILIDLDGHIKLTDFGLCTGFRWTHNSKYYQKGSHIRQDSMEPGDFWDDVSNCRCGDRLMTLEQRSARMHQRCLAHSLVGTPNYIAPEVLLRKGYTQLCDWWSVGVILFEMLVGQPPFLAPTPTETQLKVINWENTLQIPPQVKLSQEAVDIISRLCCAAEERLGDNGASEIKAHAFFEKLDFSSNLRTQPAPYLPKISHPMDTSNFDPVEEDTPWSDSGDSTKTWDTLNSSHNKHPEHAFYEFTFRRFFDDNGCPFRYPKPLDSLQSNQEQENLTIQDLDDPSKTCEPVYV